MAENDIPRGGIRITSDPDTTSIERTPSAAHERVELPFRLLYAADLVPTSTSSQQNSSSEAARLHRVDKHKFAQLLEDLAPSLELDVPNHLSDAPPSLELRLRFSSLNDFRPDSLARQVPALESLLKVRALVARVKTKEIDLEIFRSRLEGLGIDPGWTRSLYDTLVTSTGSKGRQTAAKKGGRASNGHERAKAEDDALSRLLSMVDTGASEPDGAEDDRPFGLVDALMNAASGPSASASRAEMRAVDLLLADLDDILTRQLNAVIGHPKVRKLEAAWRGLRFLVDRIDFRSRTELHVLPASKEQVDDVLYQRVVVPEHEAGASLQISCIILGFAFDSSSADVSLLDELASTAASLRVPIVASVDPAFFGIETEEGLSRLPLLWQHLEGPPYIAWNKLRSRPEARHLALALPAFLLRTSYDETNPVEDMAFSEHGHLWGGAALLVGAAAAKSVAETGWPTQISGFPIADLPVRTDGSDAVPLAAALSTEKLSELADAGFVAIGCRLGRDDSRVVHTPTVGRRAKDGDASLASELFLTRVAHFVLELQQSLSNDAPSEQIRAEVQKRFAFFLGGDNENVDVDLAEPSDASSPDVLRVHLRAPSEVLDPPIELTLGLPIEKAGRSAWMLVRS